MKYFCLCFFVFLSCVTNDPIINSDPDFARAPPRDRSYVYGIGCSRMGMNDRSMALSERRASVSIAHSLSAIARTMIESYRLQIGGDPLISTDFAQFVSNSIYSSRLESVVLVEQVRMPDGAWWTLAALQRGSVATEVIARINIEKHNFPEYSGWDVAMSFDAAFNKQADLAAAVVEK